MPRVLSTLRVRSPRPSVLQVIDISMRRRYFLFLTGRWRCLPAPCMWLPCVSCCAGACVCVAAVPAPVFAVPPPKHLHVPPFAAAVRASLARIRSPHAWRLALRANPRPRPRTC